MRCLLLVLPALVLAGCREEAPVEGAVKLTVSYTGFKPGCVQILARDAAGAGEPSLTEVSGKGGVSGGALTLAIFRASEWGSQLEVEARAFERACPSAGQAVTQQARPVTVEPGKVSELTLELTAQDVDGDGYVSTGTGGTDCDDGTSARYPGAPEVCDARDNDCDTQTDEGLGLGDSCSNPGNCMGVRQCLQDGGIHCDAPAPTFVRFRDGDSDGFGARDAGSEPFCTPPVSGYSPANTDCDDGNPLRNPMASERCDGLDDDCDGLSDDGLDLGASCTPDGGCTGRRSCDGLGGVFCEPLTLPTLYFRDEDRDTYGQADAGPVPVCGAVPPGLVLQGSDCDDGDSFTFPSARELCDVKDNDCDGFPEDAGVCPVGGPAWISSTVGVTNRSWRSASLWGDGGVWVVGTDSRRAVKLPSVASFSYINTGCTGTWLASWADPVTGLAYYSGEGGELAIQEATAGACVRPATVSGMAINGLSFLPGPSGPDFHGVGGENPATTVGRTFTWDGGTQVRQGTTPVAPLNDVHGLSREVLFAAGGYADSPRLYRFDAGAGEWQTEGVQDTTSVTAQLEAVWVVNDRLAYAVGGEGTVLRWDGSRWSSIPGPSGTETLMSVVAFGRNSIYVTTFSGNIYRYNGATWQLQATFPGDILYDIAATSPEDIWVVGESGRIIHWPQ